jgi:DNA-binding NtrC family response regulator
MPGRKILVVDDEPASRQFLTFLLQENDYQVQSSRNGVEALIRLESAMPDLIITDLQMPVMDGLELLEHARQRWPELPVVLISVVEEIATVVEAVKLGAANYLIKPATPAAVLATLAKAFRPAAPVVEPSAPCPEIVGISKGIVEARHLVALACKSDVNVLICGRTGTGKELVARAIHRCSRQAGAPFVAVNCAAIPPDLFESQFFGHKKGAFTGADQDHSGLLVRVDGGILLLDELESLSPTHQAKLLRVIDDGEVRPVGSTAVRSVCVRYLASTNVEPRTMLADGTLREDLFYRLRGFEIRLPPLAGRQEDIPLLAEHFLGGRGAGFTQRALVALAVHSWPGNVRELRNLIESAHALAAGQPIDLLHLPFPRTESEGAASDSAVGAIRKAATLKETERQAILLALEEHDGKISRAARALGIDRSTLRRKMFQYGLSESAPG